MGVGLGVTPHGWGLCGDSPPTDGGTVGTWSPQSVCTVGGRPPRMGVVPAPFLVFSRWSLQGTEHGRLIQLLAYLNTPMLVLQIVWLLVTNVRIDWTEKIVLTEYFAGCGNVAKAFQAAGACVCYCFELRDRPILNDWNGDIGFCEALRAEHPPWEQS